MLPLSDYTQAGNQSSELLGQVAAAKRSEHERAAVWFYDGPQHIPDPDISDLNPPVIKRFYLNADTWAPSPCAEMGTGMWRYI